MSYRIHFIFLGVLAAILAAFFLWRAWTLDELFHTNPALSKSKNELALLSVPETSPETSEVAPALTSIRWREVTSPIPWEARDSHALAVFRDALWIMGGLDGNGFVAKNGDSEYIKYWEVPHFDDVWESRDGMRWVAVTAHAPWGKRRSAQAVEFKGKLWLMGGWGPEIGYRADVWSSEDGIWWERVTEKAEWPAREGHSLVVFQNKLWLIGGVQYDLHKTFHDVWVSDDGAHWVEATAEAGWAPRWDHAVAAFNNRLWLTAGMDLRGNVFRDVWVSDDGINWKLVTDNPPWRERQGHVLLDYRGKLWTLGRLNSADSGNGPNDAWFTEDGFTWVKTDTDPAWAGREDHGAVVFRDQIWVVGGMNNLWQWGNDVWYSTLSTAPAVSF